jgi:outer membrane protein
MRSGWGTRVQGSASVGIINDVPKSGRRELTKPKDLSIQLTQPVFTGFRTYHAVNEAEAFVRAGRAQLRDVEGRILVSVAKAFIEVRRDQGLVQLAKEIVAIVTRELVGAKERLRGGEITRTDVDQAQSRRARASIVLGGLQGQLRSSKADYQRLIGRASARLSGKGLRLGKLPATLRDAEEIARRENALVVRALFIEQAARFSVSKERADLLPRFDIEAGYSRSYDSDNETGQTDTAQLLGRLVVPLYQGGAARARIRQVKHLHVSRMHDIEQARRRAVGDLRRAWAEFDAARRKLKLDRNRIQFAASARKGVREEERVGQRTLLDVLNAEDEVFRSKSGLVRNQRDLALAHYEILRALGRLDSDFLVLAKEQYDPEMHYFDAKEKWFSTKIVKHQSYTSRTARLHAWRSKWRYTCSPTTWHASWRLSVCRN